MSIFRRREEVRFVDYTNGRWRRDRRRNIVDAIHAVIGVVCLYLAITGLWWPAGLILIGQIIYWFGVEVGQRRRDEDHPN